MKMRYWIAVAIAVIAIIGIATSYTGYFVNPDNNTVNYDDLAKCLTQKGAIMYGTKYCPHCANQKKMFGDSFKYITYIECTDNAQVCVNAGINAVPAWNINGKIYVGVQSLQKLSELTGCKLPQ